MFELVFPMSGFRGEPPRKALVLNNPVMIAAGTYGLDGYGLDAASYRQDTGVGAIVLKTTTLHPIIGWQGKTWEPSLNLNAVGLKNPGLEMVLDTYLSQPSEIPTILSIGLTRAADAYDIYNLIRAREGCADRIDAFEVNLGCPNSEEIQGFDGMAGVKLLVDLGDIPVIVKFPPILTRQELRRWYDATKEAGACAITVSNTLPVIMLDMDANREAGKTYFAGAVAGLSGPTLHPVALAMVFWLSHYSMLPIVGCGGVSDVQQARSFLHAGADAVQIGSAGLKNPSVPGRVASEMMREYRESGKEDWESYLAGLSRYSADRDIIRRR